MREINVSYLIYYVLSLTFLCFDNLIQSGVGCRIDNIFAEAFGYANDIVLLAPSADALKITISICEACAYEFSILFNPRKSKLMCINVNVHNLDIILYRGKVIRVDGETYWALVSIVTLRIERSHKQCAHFIKKVTM